MIRRSIGGAARLLGAAAVLAMVASSMGCTVVRPWDRDMLARQDMAWDPDPLEAARKGHVYFAKEATGVHGGGGGGGCGCN